MAGDALDDAARREQEMWAIIERVADNWLSMGWNFKRVCPFCMTESSQHEPGCIMPRAQALLAERSAGDGGAG